MSSPLSSLKKPPLSEIEPWVVSIAVPRKLDHPPGIARAEGMCRLSSALATGQGSPLSALSKTLCLISRHDVIETPKQEPWDSRVFL